MESGFESASSDYEIDSNAENEVLDMSPVFRRHDEMKKESEGKTSHYSFITQSFEEEARKALTLDMYQRKTHNFQLIEIDPRTRFCYPEDPEWNPDLYYGLFDDFVHLKSLIAEFGDCICAAGGAIANDILLKLGTRYATTARSDVDLFVFGVSEEVATQKIEEAIAFLVSKEHYVGYDVHPVPDQIMCRQARVEKSLKYVNVKFCYSYSVGAGHWCNFYRTYQFVLRIYPTKASVIAGFDIPLSCYLYDGKGFYNTPLADFCARNRVVIANLSRESPSFQHRLVKYCQRFGFKLYYPGLSLEFYTKERKFDIEAIKDDFAQSIKKHNGRLHTWYEYGQSPKEWLKHLDEIIRENTLPTLHRILFYPSGKVEMARSKHPGFHSMSKEAMAQVSDYGATYAGNHQVRTINSVACIVGNIEAVICCKVYNNGRISATSVIMDFKEMCTKPKMAILKPQTLKERFKYAIGIDENHRFASKMLKHTGKPTGPYTEQDFQNLLFKHATNAKLAVKGLKGVKWMTENPGSQWTSSFQPMFTSPKEYYGEWYKPFFVGIPWPVYRELKIGVRDGNSCLSTLNNDTFRLILNALLRAYGQQ